MKKINKNNVRVGVSLDRILRYLKGNKRKAGMTVILIVAVFIVMLNSSFGYFQKRIEGRRFSFVVGTLSIELDSQDLTNNQLTIQPRKSESITVSVTNKNNVDTKYLLYYKIISPESLNDNIEGGYLPTSKSPAVGIVSKKGTNNIELIFNNTITQNVTIEIGAKAGLKNGEILLEENEFSLGKETAPKYYYYKYDSQTSYYTFQSPVVGTYQIELWGAQGGSSQGGKGAYTSGTVELNTTDPIYIYLGGQGGTSTSGRSSGGYNGGGQGYSVSSSYPGTGGGGATDVRLINGSWNNSASLASRIMVASGGGGMSNSNSGSPGGTLTGLYTSGGSTAGTQISGGKAAALGKNGTNGGFGYGGNSGAEAVGGGGSGYYGGAGASQANQNNKGAPSGSSFISGHVGCIAINSEEDITPKVTTYTKVEDSYHYSNYIFYDTIMKAGNETMPTPDLTSTMTGNSGNGYATITLLQSDDIYLTSNDIKEGYVTIEPNSSINTDVYLTKLGLNDIYYGIYYEIVSPQDTTNTIEVGYSLSSKNKAQGIISYNETKEVNMIINNIGNSEVTLKIGLKKESKESDIEYGTTEISCNKEIIQKYYKYKYSGNYEEFVSVVDGIYKIELWGAQGGGNGGKGAYTSGEIFLTKNTSLYVYVGGNGTINTGGRSAGGYNGGGAGYSVDADYMGGSGGGATDIRLTSGNWNNSASLASRIMVAAGGGGSSIGNAGSPGGALVGLYTSGGSTAGTQTSGGKAASLGQNGTNGGFGFGGDSGAEAVGGGGSGYYGGAGASQATENNKGAPSGSSYISGYEGCIAIKSDTDITPKVDTYTKLENSYHYSNRIFINGIMNAGNTSMPTHALNATQTGNTGNGYARITLVNLSSTYDIKYNANGGIGEMTNSTFAKGLESSISKNKFTKEGYLFAGWSLSPDSDNIVYEDMGVINIVDEDTKTINLYAVWIDSYTVEFDVNGGDSLSETTKVVNAGKSYGILPTPTRDSYNFGGWYTKEDGGIEITEDTIVTEINKTLYARWKAINLDVLAYVGESSIYRAGGGTYTSPTFDITDYNTMEVSCGYGQTGGGGSYSAYLVTSSGNISLLGTKTVDISGYTGNAYISISTTKQSMSGWDPSKPYDEWGETNSYWNSSGYINLTKLFLSS